MKKISILLAVALAGCARTGHPGRADESPDGAFARLSEDYVAGYLAWRPQIGASLGYHQYDGKLSDYSAASVESEQARLKSYQARLEALDLSKLSTQAAFDCRLLRSAVARELFGFEQMDSYRRNPMTYAGALDVNLYIKRNFAPLENRVRSIIAILNQVPELLAAGRANLVEVLPRPYVETAIEEAGGQADFLGNDLVEALKGVKNPSLMAEFQAADQRAIGELRGFVAWLKEKKLPQVDDHFALGRDKYIQLLQSGEMLTLSPEALLDVGRRELRAKQQVFAEAARSIDASRPPIEVFRAIQKDHPTEADLIPATARHLEMIRQFVVSHRIIDVPSRTRAHVTETPQYLRATSFASMDTPGPFEKVATEAYYYVTPPESSWSAAQKEDWLTAFNYYTTDIVSIHEAYPGHYVQFLCMNASPASRIEKIFGSYAFIEGWAHYCEQMLVDEGFGADCPPASGAAVAEQAAKYRLAQTDEALLRVCRLCVSIQMHCQGMSVDQATKFFQDNCYYEAKPARQEAVRGTFDPEYLYYTVGKLELLKLREDYRKQEGANFNLRRFHDELLRHGMPPVRLLRELLLRDPQAWAATL